MTKAELIRKLARRSGVGDSEAKIFFEIFLQNTAARLSPGEAINIKNLGFFQLKKGRLKNVSQKDIEQNKDIIYPDLMLYTPAESASSSSEEVLIFNVPAKKERDVSDYDSYFSLSFGKPVIPIKGAKSAEFFVPPSGAELRRLIETKVENLVQLSEVITSYTKGGEYLDISAEAYNTNQYEFLWSENAVSNVSDQTEEKRNIPWNFGSEIERQISEESILDVEKESIETTDTQEDKENVSWDFGASFFENIKTVEEITGKSTPEQKKELQKTIEDTSNFRRVKNLTKEISPSKAEPEQKVSWNFGEAKETSEVPAEDIKNDDSSIYLHYDESRDDEGYTPVANRRKTYDIELSSHDQRKLDAIISEEIKKENFDSDADATDDFYDKDIPPAVAEYDDESEEPHRKPTWVFLLAIVVIILISAALYFYLTETLPKKSTAENTTKAGLSTPVVIERNFEVPVTYPYTRADSEQNVSVPVKGNDSSDEIRTGSAVEQQKPKEQSPVLQKNQQENVAAKQVPAEKVPAMVKVRENLFKSGANYFVQVSSWQSKAKAEAEAARYRNKGFTVYLEKSLIPGRGTWYRVKIGSFKSEAEASKHL